MRKLGYLKVKFNFEAQNIILKIDSLDLRVLYNFTFNLFYINVFLTSLETLAHLDSHLVEPKVLLRNFETRFVQ